jgi:mevalonate kinase
MGGLRVAKGRVLRDFSIEVSGKWILAGEHAVIRGAPALVFPLKSRSFSLQYFSSEQSLSLEAQGERGAEFEPLLWSVLEKACGKTGVSLRGLKGKLRISSSIPIGAGLGASAALCVALAKWFESFGALQAGALYDFARDLENLFHGESSGVDIAVAMSGSPLRFLRGGERKALKTNWSPRFYITYSGKRGVTLECVTKVKALCEVQLALGNLIDQDMRQAVDLCEQALAMSEEEGFLILAGAMELAQSCFVRWGLVNETCSQKMDLLREAGAQAVKMTGSGDGGFILSLWRTEPPAEILEQMISCF